VRIGEDTISDPEGQDFRDVDAAWEATRAIARDIMETEFGGPVDWTLSYIEVRDEAGEIVLEFPFLEAVELPERPN
jgi:hypothetical protein